MAYDNLIHTLGSGWFPFCGHKEKPQAIGPFTDYPVAVSLEEAMGWFWKVKDWDISITYQIDERGGNNKRAYTTQTTPFITTNEAYGSELLSIHGVVCRQTRAGSWSGTGTIMRDNFGNGDFLESSYQVDVGFSFTGFWWSAQDGVIWPKIRVSGWLDSVQAGHPKVQQQLDSSVSFYIGGVSIPVRTYWFPAWVQDTDWTVTGGTQIRLTPVYF